jgi:hypothetical protein
MIAIVGRSALWVASMAAACGGCGRIGFDLLGGAASPDAAIDAPGIDAGLCGTAIQGPIDTAGSPAGNWVTSMTAYPNAQGLVVSYLAPDGVVWASTYAMASTASQLVVDTQLVAGPAGAIGVISSGSQLLLAWPYQAGAVELLPFDSGTLSGTGAPVQLANLTQIDVPLAESGVDSSFALAASLPTGQVNAIRISLTGSTGSPSNIAIVPASEGATSISIATSSTGYLVTWVDNSPLGSARAELLDSTFTVQQPPRTLYPASAQRQVRAAWAPISNTYLFVWTNGGAVEALLTDGSLTPIGGPLALAAAGTAPQVATDGTNFWVAWSSYTAAPTGLGAAHVVTTGAFSTHAIAGSGGTVIDKAFVTIAGGVYLTWVERSGSVATSDLWLVPSCLF